MRLDQLARDLASSELVGDPGTDIASLAFDNRKVTPGALFFCVRGEKSDGHDFAPAAVEAGAAALVCERRLELEVPQLVVDDSRAAMAPIAACFNGYPTQEMKVAGITGTNGKTTTAFLLRDMLEYAGVPSGLMGTVKQVVGGVEEEVVRTTPEAIDLQASFRRMSEAGDEACVMEVSSHAMVMHRADAIDFDLAVFTNLTQDHLDFHADMEDYFQAKRLLFAAGPGAAVVNVDDEYGRRLATEFDCLTYSASGSAADYAAVDVGFDAGGAAFTVQSEHGELAVRTGLPGSFNVANALAALAGAIALGVDPHEAAAGLAEAGRVPGRFEPIDEGQSFAVLVDYAHTPDSVENVLRAARGLTEGRLIAIVGAGGDRDRAKRPLMGKAGAELADLTVITSDNPRSEDPARIIEDVLAGIEDRESVVVEEDRDQAIGLAIREAGAGDTVVIAGKGHEQGQEFENGRKIPFDDRDVARRHLRELNGKPA
ncbi:MAG: UDP-N-acetylmuramoyl-L-alanyl-D-glutamate--2,6-diaminopimelate ligase [Solirubrobacterales bacterium 67-14]|nr:MAG: UDP-N-acetylmuramoyl-L-alanyl-D-glutamate--2,6-diaminopimelate ligase [Solirubrobacterales bacterium 67-14]